MEDSWEEEVSNKIKHLVMKLRRTYEKSTGIIKGHMDDEGLCLLVNLS